MAKKRSTTAVKTTKKKSKPIPAAKQTTKAKTAKKPTTAKGSKRTTAKPAIKKGVKRATARSSSRKASRPKTSMAVPAAKKYRSRVVAEDVPSIQIQTINGAAPRPGPFPHTADIVVSGTASEDFTHVDGSITKVSPPTTFAFTSRTGGPTTWTLTWAANTITTTGAHKLGVCLTNNQTVTDRIDPLNITMTANHHHEYADLELKSSNEMLAADSRWVLGRRKESAEHFSRAGRFRDRMGSISLERQHFEEAAEDWLSAATCFVRACAFEPAATILVQVQKLFAEGRIPPERVDLIRALREREEQIQALKGKEGCLSGPTSDAGSPNPNGKRGA